jgi:hypothetical protein
MTPDERRALILFEDATGIGIRLEPTAPVAHRGVVLPTALRPVPRRMPERHRFIERLFGAFRPG